MIAVEALINSARRCFFCVAIVVRCGVARTIGINVSRALVGSQSQATPVSRIVTPVSRIV